MFLNYLVEQQQRAFLSLCVYIANADGFLDENEKERIRMLRDELNLPDFDTVVDKPISLEGIVTEFSKAEEKIKKITLIEALGMAYADGSYDQSENEFIAEYASRIGIDDTVLNKQTDQVEKYMELIKDISKTIGLV